MDDPFDYSKMSVLCSIEHCHATETFFKPLDMTAYDSTDVLREQLNDTSCARIRETQLNSPSSRFYNDTDNILRKRHNREGIDKSTNPNVYLPMVLSSFQHPSALSTYIATTRFL